MKAHSGTDGSSFLQLTRFKDDTLERPFKLVEAKVQEISLYVGKWLQFQSLWDIESESVYNVRRACILAASASAA